MNLQRPPTRANILKILRGEEDGPIKPVVMLRDGKTPKPKTLKEAQALLERLKGSPLAEDEKPHSLGVAQDMLDEFLQGSPQVPTQSSVKPLEAIQATAASELATLKAQVKSQQGTISYLVKSGLKKEAELTAELKQVRDSIPQEPWEESITELRQLVSAETDPHKRQAFYERLKKAEKVPRAIISSGGVKREVVKITKNGRSEWVEVKPTV